MAPLALLTEGVPVHFFHLMEVPTMRLPNIKMLLHWPSRMHIYCFVEITLYLCTMHLLLIWSLLWGIEAQHRAKADLFMQ